VNLRRKISRVCTALADALSPSKGGEIGIAFPETAWARWGIKPYRADELLTSKALRLETYRDLMRDPVVKAALYNRVLPAVVAEWDLRPAGYDRRKRPEANDPNVEVARFVRSQLARPKLRVPRLLLDLAHSLVDGFAIVEKVYAPVEDGEWAGKVGLAALKAKDVETWDFDCDQYLNVTAVRQQVLGQWLTHPREKFIVLSWLPAFENPLGQSEFRAAYRAAWLKDTCLKFRAIYAETLAKGKQKVTYPADQGEEGLKKALAVLDKLQNAIGQAFPSDLQAEIVQMAVAPAGEFKSFVDDCNKEIVTGLEGAALQMLEGAETGAYRATETHGKTARPWTLLFGLFVESAIQDDLVQDLVDVNFAGREPCEFYIRWSREDQKPLAEVIQIAQAIGLRIPAWYVYEQLDIPQPEEDDDILEAPSSSPFTIRPVAGDVSSTLRPLASERIAPLAGRRNVKGMEDGETADFAEAADEGDPDRRRAEDRAADRAPDAYRRIVAELKKKRPPRPALISMG
jgi:hypothetical protein